MKKNVASQIVIVFAWDTANGVPKTGDSGNITAQISKDGGAASGTNTANPTEIDAANMKGLYYFPLQQGETDCDVFALSPVSGTADIDLEPVVIHTTNVENEVWDEALTGATHNVATSAGRRLRQLESIVLRYETAQAGAAQTITLDAAASAVDTYYVGSMVGITEGTGAGQARRIVQYVGATKVATVEEPWETNPDATSVFAIIAMGHEGHTLHGTGTAGANDSITFDANGSATNNIYNDQMVHIVAGTGIGQVRLITAYDGGTKVATVTPNWETNPDNTSVYHVDKDGRKDVSLIEGGDATDAINAACDTAMTDYDAATGTELVDAETALTAEIDANETKLDAVKTDTAAILVDTDTMEADLKTHIDSAETNIIAEVDANEVKLDTITTNITRMLGLMFENAVFEFTYTNQKQTAGKIYLYNSAANATTHNEVDGLIGEYSATITLNVNGDPETMKVTKVS